MTETNLVLTLQQAADRLGINRRTLERLRSVGEGPATIELSMRRVGILEADLEKWILARRRVPPGA